jgi:hypothetical protein
MHKQLTRRSLLAEQDVAITVQQMYLPLEQKYSHPGNLLGMPVEITGTPAWETRYRIWGGEPACDLREFWIVKPPALCVIFICTERTNPGDDALFEARVDALLESFA